MQENPYKNSNYNDQTLNKQGQVPFNKQGNQKINPKELSNEELEYIIKTGKLPPKYLQTQQLPLQQEQKSQPFREKQSQLAQFNIQAPNPPMKQQIQNYTASSSIEQTTSNTIYDYNQHRNNNNKENQNIYVQPMSQNVPLELGDLMNSKNEKDFYDPNFKHYSSPRMMSDYIQSTTQKKENNPFQLQSLQQTQQTMICQQPTTSVMESSMFKNNDQTISPMDQSTQSIAASNALKALQDRIKQLEKENQYLEDKMKVVEGQSNENQMKLTQKLREETEKGCTRENQLKEELFILKKQLETVEQEKLRHLEENSNERDQWRQMHKQVEEENIRLKKSLIEETERYSKIEDAVQDIKKREAQLREKYEIEVQNQRERVTQLQQDMHENKQQYERLKVKLQDKLKEQKNDYEKLEVEFIQMRESRDKENQKLKRENETLKNQLALMKEEMQLFGNQQKEKNQDLKQSKSKKKTLESQFTPKEYLKEARVSSPHEKIEAMIPKQTKSNKKNKVSKVGKRYDRNMKNTGTESQLSKGRGSKENLQCSQQVRFGSTGSKFTSRVKSVHSQRSASKEGTAKKKVSRKKQKRSESRQPVTLEPLSNKKDKINGLTGVQSESNLISINTKSGKAETLKKQNYNSSLQEKYIYIDEPKRDSNNIDQKIPLNKRLSQGEQSMSKEFHLDPGFSQQTSVQAFTDNSHSLYKQQLEFGDFDTEKKCIDNEIFYLEREIFDYNQQYKSLLSQKSLQQDHPHLQEKQGSQFDSSMISQKLRQIASQLEQKSEKLFDLKKQQQQMILKESFRGKGSLNNSTRSGRQ